MLGEVKTGAWKQFQTSLPTRRSLSPDDPGAGPKRADGAGAYNPTIRRVDEFTLDLEMPF